MKVINLPSAKKEFDNDKFNEVMEEIRGKKVLMIVKDEEGNSLLRHSFGLSDMEIVFLCNFVNQVTLGEHL